ncbi:MAG: helix-turn-helix domain-containing protein [Blastochloris sp.]|nr:helix-turn-helix domain-containing protein [Blastochloris sp.]
MVRQPDGSVVRKKTGTESYRKKREQEWNKRQATEARSSLGLSQNDFARLMGVSVDTLQNWEQGRRKPAGAARVLLRIAAKHPEAVLEVV